jgi:hypothetical protein
MFDDTLEAVSFRLAEAAAAEPVDSPKTPPSPSPAPGPALGGARADSPASRSPPASALAPGRPAVATLAVAALAAGPQPSACEEGKRVRRRDLINLINLVNFREGTIFANFRHAEKGDCVSYQAYPLPCADECVACRWLPPGIQMSRLKGYAFEGILLSDGHSHVAVKAELLRIDAEGLAFRMPESGYEKCIRSMDRFSCEGVRARLLQSGILYEGTLLDFNAVSFSLELEAPSAGSLDWINSDAVVNAMFSKDGSLLYSGDCHVTRMDRGRSTRRLVLTPAFTSITRYKAREFRGHRQSLSPAPAARLRHPFTGKLLTLQVADISGTGICVEEFFEHALLLPGMLIPEVEIEIANNFMLKCAAQVLYRRVIGGVEGNTVRCGIVFLDMEARDQARLSAVIHQSVDDRLRVCGSVDMDELWRFFFETGFIYPAKYLSIQARKEEFKRTYERLYLESPSIARHFLFQDKGQLFGHMSMVRFYSNSWIIHHHAASRNGYGMAGVSVLDEMGRYTNDFHLHPSARMDYLMCYFRRENRFPCRVFGGVTADIADPKGSSIDAFAYLHLPEEAGGQSEPFQLFPAGAEEFAELGRRYEDASGGLLLDALDLRSPAEPDPGLSAEYARQGFKRERQVYCLKDEGRLLAILLVTISDLGLNLSNLTNCVHAIVVEPELLGARTLFSALRVIGAHHGAERLPVLVFPEDYLDRKAVPYEKKYSLWVLDTSYSDGYFRSVRNTFRRSRRERDDG